MSGCLQMKAEVRKTALGIIFANSKGIPEELH